MHNEDNGEPSPSIMTFWKKNKKFIKQINYIQIKTRLIMREKQQKKST